ncbi:MAG TPA: hypothetical protein VFG50_13965, partial [Rhodothermales bacterium]|nr:hypothetical protein [Rhodothermales bacterium]
MKQRRTVPDPRIPLHNVRDGVNSPPFQGGDTGVVCTCSRDASRDTSQAYCTLGRNVLSSLRLLALYCLLFCLTAPLPARAQELGQQRISRAEQLRAYEARRDSLIDYYASSVPPNDLTRGGYFEIAAKLHHGKDMAWVLARLDTLMKNPHGDMFWMYPITTVIFEGRNRLPDDYRKRLRDLWRTYMPYRGDTENHWLLYYSTLYLMSELYPGEPGDTWFTGKSSEENLSEARDYLLSWIDLTVTKGQGEYDSPHYINVYVAPLALLYAYAQDPAMKQRAAMMLEYVLADMAAESLHGIYAGAHSRIYEPEALEPFRTPAMRFSWLLFGNAPFQPSGEAYILAASGYEPSLILYHMATDRSAPYVERELKRTRHRIRNSPVRNAPVYKYTYVRDEYALGSTQGGLLQPIQQQTWTLYWSVKDPRGARNTFFTVQPYSSPLEGTMYFSEPWEMVTELIVRSKKEYDSPWKWTGGSPYEQVFQSGSALVVLYDIPPGTRFPHISAFFSRGLSSTEEDPSGWIFARGGDALIAYYPLAPYQWRDEEGG